VTKGFEFVDAGLTFTCTVEAPQHAGMSPWWWFKVSSGDNNRYAPFEAAATDTKESVRKRILVHYAELLAIAARPRIQRPAWNSPRPKPVVDTPVTATAVPAVATTENLPTT
jgi:hypothetical protein